MKRLGESRRRVIMSPPGGRLLLSGVDAEVGIQEQLKRNGDSQFLPCSSRAKEAESPPPPCVIRRSGR